MKDLSLKNIAAAIGGQLKNAQNADCNKEAQGVDIDSRKIEKDYIFIATKGEKVDGHSFVNDVAKKGALGAIVETDGDYELPYIVVDNSFDALKKLAAFYRSRLNIPIIGVTGSVGKTSTKEFIAGTLSAKYKVLKTFGNHNNEVGMPLTLLSIKEEHEIAVVEMGISDFGEMERLASISKPDACVITNIGQCHLEKLIDRDGVLSAKTKMLDYMNPDGLTLLNGDDDKLITVKKNNNREPKFFGIGENNDYYATDIEEKGLLGSEAVFVIKKNDTELRYEVKVPLPGRHMVSNALAAWAVAEEFGLTPDEIIKGISEVKATAGRSNIIDTGKYIVIDDCYNANPVSMKAAVDLLMSANSRKVAILGDMFELGENTGQLHYSVGEYCGQSDVDVLVAIGELAKNIYDGATEKDINSSILKYYFENKEQALEELSDILKEKDSVLIKASNGMKFNVIVNKLSNQ
ncbi:MAG: UDP-N-acetylmuramoyl-tripeptide--D-alanyl-D-alanine ligase [Lachnospiraceae bacterium]|nr:UDP-N-acetylmuramoyl-tripeptide--D-alanyl-D-alanine ligase [Lachnospiraceae bacterium]